MPLPKSMLSRLAAASLTLGATAAGSSFATFPEEVLADWVEGELKKRTNTTPLQIVSTADRAAARTRVTVSALWPQAKERVEALVKSLAQSDAVAIRIGAAAGLGRILELASPVERVELVCRWTVSENRHERIAVARALALPTPVFVADLVIAELARDPDAEVRATVIGALRTHFQRDPESFARVTADLTNDVEPAVRRAARELVASAV